MANFKILQVRRKSGHLGGRSDPLRDAVRFPSLPGTRWQSDGTLHANPRGALQFPLAFLG